MAKYVEDMYVSSFFSHKKVNILYLYPSTNVLIVIDPLGIVTVKLDVTELTSLYQGMSSNNILPFLNEL